MRRISPEEVVAAYKKTGMKPVRGTYGFGRDEGCGLGVLYRAADGSTRYPDSITKRLDITDDYRSGFAFGFDGGTLPKSREGNLEIVAGYTDGCLTAMAVFGNLLEPTEPERVLA